MNRVIAWVRGHVWETVSAVLGVGLVVTLILLVTDQGEPTEVPEAATSTTTTTLVSDGSSTTTGVPDTGAGSTTTVQQLEAGVTAVVVDNVADVGPQLGLNTAALLVETPVEGGLSRFTAVFGEEVPPVIGPVRSLRPVSADLLALFDPIVFTTGGQPFVLGSVTDAGASIITPAFSIAFQSLERPQPHHVFVSPEAEGYQRSPFIAPWEVGDWPGGDPVGEVTVPLAGGVTWRFENDTYVRYRGSEPQEVLPGIDSELEPLTRETLVLLMVNEKSAGYTDGNGADVPTFDIIGGGDLYVLHAGELIEGTWFRASQDTGYVFTDTGGSVIPVPDGGLYLGLVPDDEEIDLGG